MMRNFLLFSLLFTGLMASPSFYSLSHGKFLHKLYETMVDPQTNQSFYIIDRYPITFQVQKYITKTNAVTNGHIYYPNDWDYFKAYVPAGASVSIHFVTYPNTALRLHAKFKGDKNNTFDHEEPIFTGLTNRFQQELFSAQQPTVDAVIINNADLRFNNLSIGGWLYFSLVGDVSGYYENPPGYVQVNITYSVEIAKKERFYNHLKSIRYDAPNGDPIDAIDYLIVKNPVAFDLSDIVDELFIPFTDEYNISLNRPDHTYEFNESYLLDISSDDISGEVTHSSSSSSSSSSKSSCTDPIYKDLGLCDDESSISEAMQHSSNSFSSSSSSSSKSSCTDPIYKDLGLCDDESSISEAMQHSSSSSSSSFANSSNSTSNEANNAAKQLADLLDGKVKPIKGYYIHYGEGKFQWIYVTAGNKTPYKLEGWDEENKRIIWKNLSSCLEANVEGKNIIFHKKSSCENSEEAQSSSINQSESSSSQSSLQSSSEASTYTEESYSNQSSSISSTQGFQGEQGILPVSPNN